MRLWTIFQHLGARAHRPSPMGVLLPGDRVPGDLGELAAISRGATREIVKLEPTIPLKGLCTDDVDPLTGKAYADYLERRRLRGAEDDEPVLAACVRHDVSPDH